MSEVTIQEPRSPTVRSVVLAELDRRFERHRLPGSEAEQAALKARIDRCGQPPPLLVSDGLNEEEDQLVLIDGYKRVALLEEAGVEEALAHVTSLDVAGALAALVATNSGQRGLSDLEEGWVVHALHHEHGLDQVEIGRRLGRHKTWVCRRLKLVTDLERAVQEDVRLGLVSVSTAREIAQLPRGNQAPAAKAVAQHGLNSRQAARLTRTLLDVDPSQRREVLDDPLTHLPLAKQAEKETRAKPDARLTEVANRVRQQLLRLHGAAHRLEELFLEHPPASFSRRDAAVLAELAPQAASGTRDVLEQLRQLSEVVSEEEGDHA